MVNKTDLNYNTTEISADSFANLFTTVNGFTGGLMGYGFVFVVWLVSLSYLNNYPSIDSLKASTYSAWLTSVLFALTGVVRPQFPVLLLVIVAVVTAYGESNQR